MQLSQHIKRTSSTSRNNSVCPALMMLLVVVSAMSQTAFGWTTTTTLRRSAVHSKNYYKPSSSLFASKNDDQQESVDLFDYFDPLKSPHEYPNGIGKSNGDDNEGDSVPDAESKGKPYSMKVFGMDTAKPLEVVEDSATPTPDNKETSAAAAESSDDLFDYFDPLKSPHEYPNGVDNKEARNTPAKEINDDRYDPLDLRKKREAIENNEKTTTSEGGRSNASSGGNKVGILLMDHGSRNKASNDRLQYMAELYQQMAIMEQNASSGDGANTPEIVVLAAHMEIAKPSIPDQLEALLKEGVGEIICHPYFLSPAGRHVAEDIPEIIEQAISDLSIDIPIITTDPLGANTQLMIGAINSSIRENSNLLKTQRSNN